MIEIVDDHSRFGSQQIMAIEHYFGCPLPYITLSYSKIFHFKLSYKIFYPKIFLINLSYSTLGYFRLFYLKLFSTILSYFTLSHFRLFDVIRPRLFLAILS
jgi:hypothetical protein